jgi:hypothetical protein
MFFELDPPRPGMVFVPNIDTQLPKLIYVEGNGKHPKCS